MRIFKKRGVSPLIATVLLIAFAVSLGAVIMNLGVNLTSKCESVDLEFFSAGEKDSVCFDAEKNELRFTVNNKGASIDGYLVSVTGSKPTSEEFFVKLAEFEKQQETMKITEDAVSIVTLVPYVEEPGQIRSCRSKERVYTSIRSC